MNILNGFSCFANPASEYEYIFLCRVEVCENNWESSFWEIIYIYVVVFLFYFSGERKSERKKKENVFERNEILDLLRNKKGGNDYVIFELSQSSNSSHVFPCLMKEEISVLFDEIHDAQFDGWITGSTEFSAKSAGIANFPNKTLVFTSLWGRSEKRRWSRTRVARVLSSFQFSLPLLRRIEAKKPIVRLSYSPERRIYSKRHTIEKEEEEEGGKINDESKSTTSFFNSQNNLEPLLPKTPSIHCQANTTPTKKPPTNSQTIAPKNPLEVFTSVKAWRVELYGPKKHQPCTARASSSGSKSNREPALLPPKKNQEKADSIFTLLSFEAPLVN